MEFLFIVERQQLRRDDGNNDDDGNTDNNGNNDVNVDNVNGRDDENEDIDIQDNNGEKKWGSIFSRNARIWNLTPRKNSGFLATDATLWGRFNKMFFSISGCTAQQLP